ncbi:MAG: hypothetical protein E3J71_09210 [Candidatus Stahlbacteria bacterium]|nr:MAG: hypothetical protein E3J71_09210 [Candidatus Stahlbacteria bacterium]
MVAITIALSILLLLAMVVIGFLIRMQRDPHFRGQIRLKFLRQVSKARPERRVEFIVEDLKMSINDFIYDSGLAGIGRDLVELKLVSPEKAKVLLDDNKIVIKMADQHDSWENLVTAVLAYTQKGVIPESKPYLGEELSKAMDHTLAELIIARKVDPELAARFYREILIPVFKNYDNIKELRKKMIKLDFVGIFTRIMIREFSYLSIRQWEGLTGKEMNQECKRFLDFLYRVAMRERGEEIEMGFQGNLMNIFILLIAKPEKFRREGASPYIRAVKVAISQGFDYIYILAGKENIDYAKYVAQRAQRANLVMVEIEQEFKTPRKVEGRYIEGPPAICIVTKVYKRTPKEMKETSALIRKGETITP